jgi:glycosyltransferase involved in cell wall biosynthesis
LDYPRLLVGLRNVLNNLQPDLIHAGPVQQSAFMTAILGFHPLVTMSWGSDLLIRARQGIGRWTASYTLRHSQVLVGDCQAVRSAAIGLGMPEDRIVIFPWGVNLSHFSPGDGGELQSELGWEHNFVLLSTRAFERVYDVETLFRAFAIASRRAPRLRLLALGQGSLESKLRTMVRDSGLGSRVHFAGQVDHEDLPKYYRTAQLYISASTVDGSSVSLLEAMSCGLPVLVSDIPGNREWVEPGSNGWLFPTGNDEALAEVIVHLNSDQIELDQIGRAGRKVAEKRANWQRNSKRLLEAYELATSEAPGR